MSVVDDLRAACPTLRLQEPLSKHTSFAIGGPADYYAEVTSLKELIALRKVVSQHKIQAFFLGAGSNLLVSDRGVRGLILRLQGDFRNVVFQGTNVIVGAGAMMPTVVKQAAERGLSGIEALIGVPGTIGGGLVMNAGTREGWLGNVVVTIQVLGDSLETETLTSEEFKFSYRHSNLEGRWLIGAELSLKADEKASIMKRIDMLLQFRSQTQPLATSNCGSVFKNPTQGPAALWIEKAGFKGVRVGGARVSERHANFIINENHATAADVIHLMKQIQQKVLEQSNIRLEAEVKLAGEW